MTAELTKIGHNCRKKHVSKLNTPKNVNNKIYTFCFSSKNASASCLVFTASASSIFPNFLSNSCCSRIDSLVIGSM